MTDDLTIVQVAQSALLAFIEQVACAGGTNIKVSIGDAGWYVTYKPPFARDLKEDAAKELKKNKMFGEAPKFEEKEGWND